MGDAAKDYVVLFLGLSAILLTVGQLKAVNKIRDGLSIPGFYRVLSLKPLREASFHICIS
jgi:hypothetical protein